MIILANFDDILIAFFEKTDKLAISNISDLLKKIDDDLFASKSKHLKTIRISPRSVLTSKEYNH